MTCADLAVEPCCQGRMPALVNLPLVDLQASETVPTPQVVHIKPDHVSAGKPDLSNSLQEGQQTRMHHQGKLDGVYTEQACALQSESLASPLLAQGQELLISSSSWRQHHLQ